MWKHETIRERVLASVCDDARRGVLVTPARDGSPLAHVALIDCYTDGCIELVLEASPGMHVADDHALLFVDEGDLLFFAEGRALGDHDPSALRRRWPRERTAMHPRRWHEPSLLAVTLRLDRAESFARPPGSWLGRIKQAVRALRGVPRADGPLDEARSLFVQRERPEADLDPVDRAGVESFPASDPPSFNPGHA